MSRNVSKLAGWSERSTRVHTETHSSDDGAFLALLWWVDLGSGVLPTWPTMETLAQLSKKTQSNPAATVTPVQLKMSS